MVKIVSKLKRAFIIANSIYFNFHYLPFKQAIKIPIFLHKPKFINLKGTIKIESDKIYRGMIQMGFKTCHLYPDAGIVYENNGGGIIFKGSCRIGNDSSILVGKNGTLIFGEDFANTARAKIICSTSIIFGNHCRLGWDTIVMDTSFHPLYDMEKKKFNSACKPIVIGDYNWFGLQCIVMPGVNTPERCIFGLRSIVNRNAHVDSYCTHGGYPLTILRKNVMRILGQDQIEF